MKKILKLRFGLLFLLCMCVAITGTFAQNTIQGKVLNHNNSPLPSASIIALNSLDSVLVGFGLSDIHGRFRIEGLPEGKYIFQTSFLGYLDSHVKVEVRKGDKSIEIPSIQLKEGHMKLDEVVITANHVPMRMSNDTISYNANAFDVKAHESVEDLIKKLPGVEVAKDGSIKVQGEQIEKVLVEGKEFFGNDPTIATRNLPADAVERVEVFNKKSEMAEFSGIDDGMEQKTINLALKEDHKKGFFGNGKSGYGTLGRYDAKFNVNSFKGDATWTALGMANNVNEQGFSLMDYIGFMGGFGALGGSEGRIEVNSDDMGIPIGQDFGQGFMNTMSGGINYNNDLSDNDEISASYFYTRLDNEMDRRTLRQNLLNAGRYDTDESAINELVSNGHTLNLKYKTKNDTSYRITFGTRIIYNDGLQSKMINRSLVTNNVVTNKTESLNVSSQNRINFGFNGTYSKRLNNRGRLFSLNGNINRRDKSANGILNSISTFFNNRLTSLDTINQQQIIENNAMDYKLVASYTEPLGKGRFLEFNINHQNLNNDYSKEFYDIFFVLGDENAVINNVLSDIYNRNFLYSRAGVKYKINRKKYNATLGINLQFSDQSGEIKSNEFNLDKNYFSVLPSLRFNYDIHTSRSIRIDYVTNIRAPSLEQLQPQLDNSDPLNLYQGNPNLIPEYNHHLELGYHSFSSFSNTLFFTGLNATYTQNRITNTQVVDANFVQKVTPVNVDYDIILRGYLTFSFPIRAVGIKAELNSNVVYNKGILILNAIENNTKTWYNDYSLSLQNRKKKHFDLLVGSTVRHNVRKYSDNADLDRSFFTFNYYSDLSKDFGDKWRFKTSIDYKVYPEESFGGATDLTLLGASLSMNFLKSNKGQLTVSVVDIFNQNSGIDRTTSLNYIQDQRIVSLGRYAMVSFGYSFAGFDRKKNSIEIENGSRRR